MIARMVELIPERTGPFRTCFPQGTAEWAAAAEKAAWERTIRAYAARLPADCASSARKRASITGAWA